jgi:hypothetical protein
VSKGTQNISLFHSIHHRQAATCSSADDEPGAFPRYVLFNGQRCVSEIFAELLGRRFPAFSNLPAVDDHIVLVRAAVDPEGAEGSV